METSKNYQTITLTMLVAMVLLLGYIAVTVTGTGSGTGCEPVSGFEAIVAKDRPEVDLLWEKGDESASYLIVIQDITQSGRDTIVASFDTKETKFTLRNLFPKRKYRVNVYTLCKSISDAVTPSEAVFREVDTNDWIVIDDIVHINPDGSRERGSVSCSNFDTCTDVRMTGITWNWGTPTKEYFKVKISPSTGGAPLAVSLIEKDFTNPSLKKVIGHTLLECDETDLDLHGAKASACAAPLSGTLCSPTGSPVNYNIQVTATGFTVNILSIGTYTITVESCH